MRTCGQRRPAILRKSCTAAAPWGEVTRVMWVGKEAAAASVLVEQPLGRQPPSRHLEGLLQGAGALEVQGVDDRLVMIAAVRTEIRPRQTTCPVPGYLGQVALLRLNSTA